MSYELGFFLVCPPECDNVKIVKEGGQNGWEKLRIVLAVILHTRQTLSLEVWSIEHTTSHHTPVTLRYPTRKKKKWEASAMPWHSFIPVSVLQTTKKFYYETNENTATTIIKNQERVEEREAVALLEADTSFLNSLKYASATVVVFWCEWQPVTSECYRSKKVFVDEWHEMLPNRKLFSAEEGYYSTCFGTEVFFPLVTCISGVCELFLKSPNVLHVPMCIDITSSAWALCASIFY